MIVLSGLAGDEIGQEARAAGAEGHLMKGAVRDQLMGAVLGTAHGNSLTAGRR